jgi:hypothetical protein
MSNKSTQKLESSALSKLNWISGWPFVSYPRRLHCHANNIPQICVHLQQLDFLQLKLQVAWFWHAIRHEICSLGYQRTIQRADIFFFLTFFIYKNLFDYTIE